MQFRLFCCFLLLSAMSSGQTVTAKLVAKQSLTANRFFGVDKYGSIYTAKKNILYKNSSGKTYHYSALQLGSLTSVDLLNPLSLVLFYKNKNTVVLLDDNLNEIRRINFNTLPRFPSIGKATKANHNSLWIFNVDNRELEVFDYKHKRIRAHTQPIAGEIKQQKSNYNYCWIWTENQLLEYNIYGNFIASYPADKITKIAFYHDFVLIWKGEKLFLLQVKTGQFYRISIDKIAAKGGALIGQNLYLYDGKYLYHYQLSLPK